MYSSVISIFSPQYQNMVGNSQNKCWVYSFYFSANVSLISTNEIFFVSNPFCQFRYEKYLQLALISLMIVWGAVIKWGYSSHTWYYCSGEPSVVDSDLWFNNASLNAHMYRSGPTTGSYGTKDRQLCVYRSWNQRHFINSIWCWKSRNEKLSWWSFWVNCEYFRNKNFRWKNFWDPVP